ncbi:hypothetical protein WR25_18626 [Diploscapter pachys]|uniref:V-SNARE coiled-coil homology domain-containing protein n=1 Tax=Diploscapter pachys TaxID=2018661 RepID=A0A2A2LMX0_9BILA|nr:hypothetical protein WR25_18626 [Diploscapter pachys]
MEPKVHRLPPIASVAEARQWEDKIQKTQREVALVMDVIRADIGKMQERGGRLDSLAERASPAKGGTGGLGDKSADARQRHTLHCFHVFYV